MEYDVKVVHGDFDVLSEQWFLMIKEYFKKLFFKYGQGRVIVSFFGYAKERDEISMDGIRKGFEERDRNGLVVATETFSSWESFDYSTLLRRMRSLKNELGFVHAIKFYSVFEGNIFVVKINSDLLPNTEKARDFGRFFNTRKLSNKDVDVLLRVDESIDSGCLDALGVRKAD